MSTRDDLPRVTLIVKSGLHQDAVLELTEPAYTIGASPDCDIVLRDADIAPKHCRVLRTIAGVSLCDIRSDSPRALTPAATTREDGSRELLYTVGAVQIALIWHVPVNQTLRAEVLPTARSVHRPRTALMVFSGLLLTALVLAAAGQIAAHFRLTIAERIAQGDQALLAAGFTFARFQATGAGDELELTGFVANAAGKRRLREWLAHSAYKNARVRVHDVAALTQQVRDTLADPGLKVSFDGQRLRIAGTTADLAVRARIRALGEDLQGVAGIEDRVAYVEANAAPGPLPVRIRDVMVGAARYFSSDSGERYFEGALLPDGAEVLAIEAHQIRFRRDGRELVYNLD
jgi:Inner membrane component of T3SS, cytoplasmic domain